MSKRPRDPDFTDLPTDLIRSIGPYLPTSDYSAFRGTSRAVHAQLPTCKTLIPQVSSCVADKQLPYPQCEDYCYQYSDVFSLLALLELCANFRTTSKDNLITPNGNVKVSRFIDSLEGELMIENKRKTRSGQVLILDWEISNDKDNNTLIFTILSGRMMKIFVRKTIPYPNSVNLENLIQLIQNWPFKIVYMTLITVRMMYFAGTSNEELDDDEGRTIFTNPQNVARYNLDSDVRDAEIAFDPNFPEISRFFIPDNVTYKGDNFGLLSNVYHKVDFGYRLFYFHDWKSMVPIINQRIFEVFHPL